VVDRAALHGIFNDHPVDGVVHLAGFKYAGVSVQHPLHTYIQNVTGTVSLLEEMAEHGIDKIVFSSSAATYGSQTPESSPRRTRSGPSRRMGSRS
jgi:UDP-glucose 4-epimerase